MSLEVEPLRRHYPLDSSDRLPTHLRYAPDLKSPATKFEKEKEGYWSTSQSVEAQGARRSCWLAAFGLSIVLVALGALFFGLTSVYSPGKLDHEVRFFVLGDWGREGNANQTSVAVLMGNVASFFHPEFIISTDPNGLNSTEDPLVFKSFSDVYNALSLRSLLWHAVPGNHDYGDGFEYCRNDKTVPCQRSLRYELDHRLTKRDKRWHCERSYNLQFRNGMLEIFFLDTSPFDDTYRNRTWAKYEGGILEQSWEAQLRELEARLSASTALWKVAVGHHPPRSNGQHGNNSYVMNRIEPVLQKHGVRAYFSGHDHDLEHIYAADRQLDIFVTGAGSDCTDFVTQVDSKYQHAGPGFVAVVAKKDLLEVSFYTVLGGPAKPQYVASIPLSLL